MNEPRTDQPNDPHPTIAPPVSHTPKVKSESFIKKQLKLAASTAVVSSIATIAVSFWVNVGIFVTFIGILVLGIGALASGEESLTSNVYGPAGASNRFLSVKVTGPIEGTNEESDGVDSLFGSQTTAYGYDIKKQLIEAASGGYQGIILEVNSPGGTIYGSKAISDGIKQYKELSGKPVYAFISGMAASGGYWAAAEADKILADTGSSAGSIGVIFGPFTYYNRPTATDGGLLGGGIVTQGGIEETYITAGKGKDAGNPFRRLTPEEISVFKEGVDDNYNAFVKHVSERRKIPEDEIRNNIGAHLYGEVGAKKRKLIDDIASREQAYVKLAEEAKVPKDDFEVVSEPAGGDNFWSSVAAKVPGGQHLSTQLRTKPTAKTGSTPSVCSDATRPLAYHGNIMQMCSK